MSGSSSVNSVGQLNTAIEAANALAANSGTYTITLTSNITLASLSTGINPLDAIDLNTGVVLDIVGTNGSGSYALIGAGTQGPVRGLFVYAGTVDVTNLLIENMDAKGGSGGSEAGGGAGLGGGLFVGSNVAGDAGNVTLNNVSFSGNSATGGTGAYGNFQAGGGGGLGGGGASGAGPSRSKGGGGGGLGTGVSGGVPGQGGATGIVSGGAPAGKGGSSGGAGGAEGGGGGGGGPSPDGGGAGGGGGVSGGNGGSASLASRGPGGGVGGFGGGGGGGGGGFGVGGGGGKGGFGGGGGAGSGIFSTFGGRGGQGGFGGGGGGGGAEGIGSRNGGGGAGGFGGGNAGNNSSGGGGGLGAGGDIFVQAGASLTIEGNATTSLADGTVTGGSTVLGNQTLSQPGQAFGPGIYLQGTLGVLTFNSNGTTETIAASITDDKGAAAAAGYGGAPGYTEGSIGIVKGGAGSVILTGTNTYTGGSTINVGTLQVASVANIGTGDVTFGGFGATLAFSTTPASGSTFADPLTGFAAAGTIDLQNLAFTPGASVGVSGSNLTLTDGATTENFTLSSAPAAGTEFYTFADGPGGTGFSATSASVSSIGQLNTEIEAAKPLAANTGTFSITLTGDITLGGTAIAVIDLAQGNTLDIVGTKGSGSYALIGGGTTTPERGLFVTAGAVSIQDLLIEDMAAKGGNGALDAGGAAGLGGGLFVGSEVAGDAGNVTLNNVSFSGDSATGGKGGVAGLGSGGGGGLGGNGVAAPFAGSGGNGGAGIGSGTGGGGAGGTGAFGGGVGGKGGVGFGGGGGGGSGGDTGGNGGFGGFGGGGGAGGAFFGTGGGGGGNGGRGGVFGGGGGGGGATGGFGGGGGSGGFGAGNGAGNGGGGGGGLAAGGDIFVQGGASLTIAGTTSTSIATGTVTQGAAGGSGAGDGQLFGGGIYLQGTLGVLTFDSNGTTETIAASITDDKGAATAAGYGGAANYTEGSTGIVVTGGGTVTLTGDNTYTGGTTIDSARLQIGSAANIGTGAVTFSAPDSTLAISTTPVSGSTFADPLTGFASMGQIDLQNLSFTQGATAIAAGTTLTLTDGGTTEIFSLSSAPGAGTNFFAYADGATGTTISNVQGASVSDLSELNAAIAQANALGANAGTFSITLTGDITLGGTAIAVIDLAQGNTLDIVGTKGSGSYALIGGGTTTPERGLFVTAGAVSIQDLLIEDMAAKGGNGALDAGGAAGLGGGLFVGSEVAGDAGNVTLNNVSFSGDSATGGKGGVAGLGSGGGGGLGGNGVAAPFAGSGGNGGAGIGSGTGGGGAGGTGAFGGGVGGKGGVGFGGGGGGGSGGDTGGNGGFGGFGGGGGAGGAFFGTGGGGGGNGGRGGVFGGGGGGGGATGGFGGGGGGSGGFGAGNGAGNGGGGGGGLAAGGDIFVQGGASLTIAGTTSTSIATGTVTQGAAGGSGAGAGQLFGGGIYLQGTLGVLTFDSNGTTETIAASITDDKGAATAAGYGGAANYTEGSTGIVKTGAGTVVLSAANTYSGGTMINAGTVDLAAGGSAGSGAIGFGASTADLQIDAAIVNGSTFADALTGFAVGGTVDLTALTYVPGATADLLNDTLTVNAGGTIEYFVLNNSPPAGTPFYAFSDGPAGGTEVSSILCFLDGTRIATPAGDLAVERLAPGDMVMTVSGEARPIVWIGTGLVSATRGRRTAATPVIVRRGALGDNVPHHDLRVTKGHALYLDGVLIPVEFLVNHRTILWDDHAQQVALYHIELGTHDVLVANGAPAESYRDDGNRWLFRNANAEWDLPPQEPYAAVLTGGPVVDAIWRRLLDRAGAGPQVPLTDDADLHLVADGQRFDAVERVGDFHVFLLPAVRSDPRIVSRAAAPAELGLARDPRVLGVAMRSVMVRKGTRFQKAEAGDARLADGFHGFEPDQGLRWTDGDAAIPSSLFAGLAGPFEVLLRVGATTQYRADG